VRRAATRSPGRAPRCSTHGTPASGECRNAWRTHRPSHSVRSGRRSLPGGCRQHPIAQRWAPAAPPAFAQRHRGSGDRSSAITRHHPNRYSFDSGPLSAGQDHHSLTLIDSSHFSFGYASYPPYKNSALFKKAAAAIPELTGYRATTLLVATVTYPGRCIQTPIPGDLR